MSERQTPGPALPKSDRPHLPGSGLPADETGLRLAASPSTKYGAGTGDAPPDMESAPDPEGVFTVRPRVIFAWSTFPRDATRLRFDGA